MLAKTQLFAVKNLKPNGLRELDELLELIQAMVVFQVERFKLSVPDRLYNIHCSRVDVNYLHEERIPIMPMLSNSEQEAECRQLTQCVGSFVQSVLESQLFDTTTHPGSILNFEVCYINGNTVLISFETYSHY